MVGTVPRVPAGAHRVAFQYCFAVICQPHGARTGEGCGAVTHRAQPPTEAVRGKGLWARAGIPPFLSFWKMTFRSEGPWGPWQQNSPLLSTQGDLGKMLAVPIILLT